MRAVLRTAVILIGAASGSDARHPRPLLPTSTELAPHADDAPLPDYAQKCTAAFPASSRGHSAHVTFRAP